MKRILPTFYPFLLAIFIMGIGLALYTVDDSVFAKNDMIQQGIDDSGGDMIPNLGRRDALSSGTVVNKIFVYLPLIIDQQPKVVINDAWTADKEGKPLVSFRQNEEILYKLSGVNNLTSSISVTLRWIQSGPCNQDGDFPYQTIFTDILYLEPGEWQHEFQAMTPGCSGLFVSSAVVEYNNMKSSQDANFAVNHTSTVVIRQAQGFDKCGLPETWKMKAWMEHSPYRVFNLYLGGISFACKNNPLDAVWVRKVADMGWSFIQTWVGPQAPCTSHQYKISTNKNTAYNEGRAEAQAAVNTSLALGFFGEKIIYYDIEAYHDDSPACRDPVNSFIRGWTARLHELGYKAGGYGQSCSSFITDWASINPSPDDVWIATWYTNNYDPNASVWNAPCLSNSLWKNHQRIKQYAGGHVETWGGVAITMDSSVLDGEVTRLDDDESTTNFNPNISQMDIYGTPINGFGLIDSLNGWVISNGHLLVTFNGGDEWNDVTPPGQDTLSARFVNQTNGWTIGRIFDQGPLVVSKTVDGGKSWEENRLDLRPSEMYQIQSASLSLLNSQNLWVSVKLHSGSSFSIGKLFVSEDGGISWSERVIPIGEEVYFLDRSHGWIAGGAAGDEFFYTQDGGITWREANLPGNPGEVRHFGRAVFINRYEGWLPVVVDRDSETYLVIYQTRDGGVNWFNQDNGMIDPVLGNIVLLAHELPWEKQNASVSSIISAVNTLPEGTVDIKFINPANGWVVVQSGGCSMSDSVPNSSTMHCTQSWRLFATQDGGKSWTEFWVP